MVGDRPVSRWLLTPWRSVLLHRRRERVSGGDVLIWGGWGDVGVGDGVGRGVGRYDCGAGAYAVFYVS